MRPTLSSKEACRRPYCISHPGKACCDGEGYVCVESLGALGEIVSTTAEKRVAGGWTLNKVGLVVTCWQGLKGMDTWERCRTFLLCSSGENNYILMGGIQR